MNSKTEQRVKVNGINFAVRFDGNESGPVVMMAHAMGTNMYLWDQQIEALADRYRIVRYDWRGHGSTDAPKGPYTLNQFVEDAVGVMDALSLPKVHWVGISTGGMIGQGVGIHHGDRVRSLTLCNTVSQANESYREWVAERQAVVKKSGMNPVWDMTRHLWFTDEFVEAASPEYCAVRDEFVKTKVDGYLGGTSAVAQLAFRQDLHRINTPTRIIAAGDDPVTPADPQSTDIHQRIKGSTLEIIKGQRHFSNVEVPQTFNTLLRRGLDIMDKH